jgi:hypothetical protein
MDERISLAATREVSSCPCWTLAAQARRAAEVLIDSASRRRIVVADLRDALSGAIDIGRRLQSRNRDISATSTCAFYDLAHALAVSRSNLFEIPNWRLRLVAVSAEKKSPANERTVAALRGLARLNELALVELCRGISSVPWIVP